MTINKYVISLGSNINRKNNLRSALSKIENQFEIDSVSNEYEFDCVNNHENPKYLNQIIIINSELSSEEVKFKGDYVLVSIGRRPYTDRLGLDKAGVNVDEKGRVEINDHYQTNVSHIYAIGDVVKGPMLAHKASEEAVVCVEQMNGHKPKLNYNCIPGVIYTWPEVASVGKSEEQLKETNIEYKSGKFPFKASGRARASNESEGFIKVLSDKHTDEILGVHMIGPRVSDMIGEAIVAMEYRASAEDIGMMTHAHPSFSEAIKEAALDATEKRALHF